MGTSSEIASARAKAILTADAATGRETLANHLAYSTELSFETAIAALYTVPADADAAAEASKAGWAKAAAKQNAGRSTA